MSDKKNPLEQIHKVALYQSLKHGWGHVSTFYGEDDSQYHGEDYVRISEPYEVKFVALTSDEAIQNAVATLDAAERKIRLELQQRLDAIQERRKNLLSLTHQTEPQS